MPFPKWNGAVDCDEGHPVQFQIASQVSCPGNGRSRQTLPAHAGIDREIMDIKRVSITGK